MVIIETIPELTLKIKELKRKEKTIGFVPTMGYLHAGHLRLIQESVRRTDFTIVSIFVNPAQFNDIEDFEKYPKDRESDIQKCQAEKVDLVFMPSAKEIYPNGKSIVELRVPHLMKNLCAITRPGHFEGVLLVISKFFHLVQADIAFFGKKDYQQYLIIKKFSEVMGFPLNVEGLDTVRESDGLAMSSRNARLNPPSRKAASLVYEALKKGKKMVEKGESNIQTVKNAISEIILSSPLTQIDYLEIVTTDSLEPLETIEEECLIPIAVFVDGVRLIDNMIAIPQNLQKFEG